MITIEGINQALAFSYTQLSCFCIVILILIKMSSLTEVAKNNIYIFQVATLLLSIVYCSCDIFLTLVFNKII